MKTRKMSALMLVLLMLFTCLAGCGKTNSNSNVGSINSTDGTFSDNGGVNGSGSQQADGNIAMGRYVEEVTDFAEDRISGYGCRLHRLSDGRIVLSDNYRPFLISDDNGATWKEDDREWHTRLLNEGKLPSAIAVGADNTVAVIYNDDSSDAEAGERVFNEHTFTPRLLVIKPDGTENLIDISVSGEGKYLHNVGIADNGRIIVSITGSSDLYEVKEDGSCEYFMTVQGDYPELMQFQGNLMFLDVHDKEQPLIYDMEKKEYVEDEVLDDFIRENYPAGNTYNITGTYQMYFFTGEEGVMYIAGKKGLHRHVIGGIVVEYEIGMEEGSPVTREDALKKLNTRIMAGEGPDVLVLDDMPLDSYSEKGVLLDLSTLLGNLSGEEEIFDSIVQAMKMDDRVYVIPCEIQIPVMMGAEKYISQLKDLESIADMMEELREDNPGKNLLDICTEKGIMRYFAMSCVSAWTTESGKLDREAVGQFLKQTKRIYDAQIDGLPEKTIEAYKKTNESYLQNRGETRDDAADLRTDDNVMFYVGGTIQLTYAALSSTDLYDKMLSVNKVEGFEGSKWTVMNGQSSNVFCAKTLLGINATSESPGLAESFIKLCLSRENQSNLFYGLAVNKAAFDENFIMEDNVERYAFLKSDEDGNELTMNIYQSNEDQITDLRKCIEAADTPYIEDTVLENVVYEEGIRYMQGTQSLEEAVNAIETKLSIYIAE